MVTLDTEQKPERQHCERRMCAICKRIKRDRGNVSTRFSFVKKKKKKKVTNDGTQVSLSLDYFQRLRVGFFSARQRGIPKQLNRRPTGNVSHNAGNAVLRQCVSFFSSSWLLSFRVAIPSTCVGACDNCRR